MRFVPTTELQPVLIRPNGSWSDDQRAGLTTAAESNAQTTGLLLDDLPRRRRPDQHTDDAEEQRDDDCFRDQCADEVVAPPLRPLLGLGAAQLARDDDEVECAERKQGHDQNELQNERLSVRGPGEGRDVANLKPRRVET